MENKIVNNYDNDSIIMVDENNNLIISFNKSYNRVYCGNLCTDDCLNEFLVYLAKKRFLQVEIVRKGYKDEKRTLIELKSKRKTRKDKGQKRKKVD